MPARIATLETPIALPEDSLKFAALSGFDEISRCFEFRVSALCQDDLVLAPDILGRECCVTALTNEEDDGQIRYFSGICDSLSFDGNDEDEQFRYTLVLRPALALLDKTRDNRIFQEMSVPDIVSALLDQHGITNYELRLSGSYEPRVYCVQYGETTLNFIQRLLEHEGIFYFHEFDDLAHKLILCDDLGALEPHSDVSDIRFEPNAAAQLRGEGVITKWQGVTSVRPGIMTQTDYDFEKPSADLMARHDARAGHPNDGFERYDYPGHYLKTGRGDALTDLRWQEGQRDSHLALAESSASLPAAGHTITLFDHPRMPENGLYVLLRADYALWDDQYASGRMDRDETGFVASWRLVPEHSQWRPRLRAPRPVMRGPQTAQVVGPAGEEIYTDAYSRVKVQFHWDREGQRDENASCWVRVSAAWAGSGWGFIQIPRIGQEVIVDFLEGDPDQPIITGRVYNAEQMPPYELPAEATKSGWKSNSSKGGGGWNELMFEDMKGSELVYFQAEKDHDELVKNNETRHIGNDWSEDVVHDATQWVGHNRDETVDNCKTTHVKVDRTVNIDHDDTETVGNNRALTVGVNETIAIGVNSTETIGANHTQTVGANQTVTVKANRIDVVAMNETRSVGMAQANTIGLTRSVAVGVDQSHDIGNSDSTSVGQDQALTVGKDQSVSVGENRSLSVGKDSSVSVGENFTMSIGKSGGMEIGKDFTITAEDSLTLKCGKAKIVMKKDGTISIEGKDITLKGSGKIDANASSDVTIKGAKVKMN
ncbi:type VI secretion system tip protein VgrG [Citreicella sp. C3M06]|uniref:type VI secretion system Vgr family protein n=1 Tax=Citreicella sp. C3M06 TaxID=2841564 RepID=UPI001C093D12|nr:type VI secretion system tip protein TssI/VgrG [Citreicella sp. C3M06]MBU2961475.1 type VI secretion system tip protein VgrG [Citreicella sp. C3M06]